MKITYNDADFVWISHHWDVHLEGLCRVNNELMHFKTIEENIYDEKKDEYSYDQIKVDIFKLGFTEKLRWILKWRLFELCVGTHWTYPQKNSGRYTLRKPLWFWNIILSIYYKRKLAL